MIIEDLEYYPECSYCGACFETQEAIDELIYSRTTASADHYYCSQCKREGVDIPSDDKEEK